MGTGKSTVGPLVARLAGAPFDDLDARIERAAGTTIPALFDSLGEAGFRELERVALADWLEAHAGSAAVLALGGGALLDPERRRDARERAVVVTLTAPPATLELRTRQGARPLLEGDRGAHIVSLLAARGAAYRDVHAQVDTQGRAPHEVARAVLDAWLDPD